MSKFNAQRARRNHDLLKRSSKLLAAAVAGAGLCNSVLAASGTWTFIGAPTSWGIASNWLSGTVANGTDFTADFSTLDLTGDNHINIEVPRTIGNLTFGDTVVGSVGNWFIDSSNILTLDVSSGSSVITVNAMGANAFTEIDTVLAGNDGMTKAGAGTLILTASNTFSGPLSVTGGTLSIRGGTAPLGSTTNINLAGGNLELKSDADTTYSQGLTLSGNATVIVDQNNSGTGPNKIHTVGSVSLTGTGTRTMTVVGNNGYALKTGAISAADSAVLTNNATSNPLTIGGYNALNVGATTLTLNGAGSIVVNGAISSTGGGTLTVANTGTQIVTINAAMTNTAGALRVTGGGTVAFGAGATLPNASSLVVTNGIVDLSGSGAVTHSIGSMTLGGAGNATITTGGSTLAVSGDITRNAGNSIPVINGNLNLGATAHTISVNGDSLSVPATVSGSGSIVKAGAGSLALTGSNSLSAAVTINAGTVSGAAQGAGNALSTGAHVLNGGALELLGGGSPGAGSIGAVTFGDTGSPRIFVNASGGNPTTLNIGALNGRVGGTKGTLTLIPSQGSLDTNEIFNMVSLPTLTNGIVPASTVLQQSSGDNTLDFVGLSGSHLVKATYSGVTGPTSVFNATSGLTVSGTQSVYALRNQGQTIDGSGTLVVGDDTNPGGIIMNGGQITTANLSFGTLGNSEGIVWGGSGGSNINSAITLKNTLTTAGPGDLTFGGPINLNGGTQTINTTGLGSTTISGLLSNGNVTKTGAGLLVLNGNQSSYSGTTTVSSGTLMVSSDGGLGSGAVVTNANLVFNATSLLTVNNAISGSGGIIVTGGNTARFGGNLSYLGSSTISSGTLQITGAANRLPTGTTLAINTGSTFDMNGLAQQVAGLTNGDGGAGTVLSGVAGATTLTINNTANLTYGGNIMNGLGTVALVKTGTGTQTIAPGSVNNYSGGTRILGGTLYLGDASSGNANALGTGTVTLSGGTLAMASAFGINGNGVNLTNRIDVPAGATGTFFLGNRGSASGTLTGAADSVLNVLVAAQAKYSANNSNGNAGNVTGNWTGFLGQVNVTAPNGPGNFRLGAAGTANVYPKINLGTGVTAYFGPNPPNGGTLTSEVYVGELTGVSGASFGGSTVPGRFVNIHVGSLNTSSTFNGVLEDSLNPQGFAGPGVLRVDKVGLGTWTLTNVNTYTGSTSITNGVLNVAAGALAGTPTLTIGNGATFMVSGTGSMGAQALVLNTGVASTATGRFDVTGVSPFLTRAGLTLTGNGTVVGSVNHVAGTVNPGALGGAGSLGFANNFTLAGGLFAADVSGSTGANIIGSGTNDLLKIAGNLTLSSGTVSVNWLAGGIPANGTDFPIMQFSGTETGALSSIAVTGSLPGTFSLSQPSPGIIAVHVTNIVVPHNTLTWKGNVNTSWDVNLTSNWIDTGHGNVTAKFVPGDNLTFDDTANTGSINVTTNVAPDSMVFNNSGTTYSLNGLGTISGATGIVKNNTGSLVINNVNTFTGGITVNGGTVVLNNTGAGGSGSVTLNTGGALQFAQSGTANNLNVTGNSYLNFGSINNSTYSGTFTGNATLNLTANGVGTTLLANLDQSNFVNFTGTLNVGSLPSGVNLRLSSGQPTIDFSNAYVNLGDNTNGFQSRSGANMLIGALTGGPSSQLVGAQAAGTGPSTFTIGNLNQSTTFSGAVNDAAGTQTLNIVKVGTGTLTLGGGINNTGVTQVDGGVIEVTGNFNNAGNVNINTGTLLMTNVGGLGGNKVVNVNAAGTLDLSAGGFNTPGGVTLAGIGGNIKGNVNHNGGTIAAGGINTLGTLNFDNDLSLSGGTVSFDLTADTTPGGTTNDLVNVAGNFDMSSGNVVINFLGNSAGPGSVYKLVGYGSKTGAATNLNLVNNTRASVTLSDAVAGQLSLNVVTGSVGANLKWTSTGDSNWDVNSHQNWLNTGTSNSDFFFNGDNVLFNDDTAGVQTAVVLPTAVVPASVTVNSTTNSYTISGPGQIIGSAGLLKQGGSTLTLAGNNTYSGGTQVQGGTLALGSSGSAGSGSIAMSGTSNISLGTGVNPANQLNVAGTNNLYMATGNGTYSGAITGNGTLIVNKPDAVIVTMNGDMSTFSGTLSMGTSIAQLRFNNSGTNTNSGSPLAMFDLGTGSSSLVNRNGGAMNLGGLSGGSLTSLSGASDGAGTVSTYNIGSANVSTTFAGSITDAAVAPRLTAINKVGSSTLTLSGALSYTGGTNVTSGTLVVSSKLPNGTVTINGGTAVVSAKGTPNSAAGTSVIPSLTIVTGGALDLTNNSMVIDYTGPVGTQVSDVRGHLRNGRLTSSSATATTRLGYGDNAVLNKTSFGGVSVDSSSILIKYTYAGDADLDGDADGVDIGTWATNFTGELGGTGSMVWTQGDWDYDGDVDGVDAGLWAQAFTGELGGNGLGSVVVDDPNIAPGAAAILRGMGITVVPEPASVGLLALGSTMLLGRRRRRA